MKKKGRKITHKNPPLQEDMIKFHSITNMVFVAYAGTLSKVCWVMIKFHSITNMVFVAYAGTVTKAYSVVERVKYQLKLKIIPHTSIKDIARTLYGLRVELDFILFGHMRNEDEPQMIMIFPFGNFDPPIEAANASNAASVKLCSGVSENPYIPHLHVMCAIGSESKVALKSLQKVTRINNNEEEMRKVAVITVFWVVIARVLPGELSEWSLYPDIVRLASTQQIL